MIVSQQRQWDVLLLGGASGTGKTSVSYPLARHYGVGITEVDDIQIAMREITSPEQQSVLHYWHTHPEALEWPPERILELHLAVAQVMQPSLAAVIANHLESRTPIILEGDYLLPSLAAPERVRAVFLYEPDEQQFIRNFLGREVEAGEQNKRGRVSWLYGQWLKEEAQRHGLPALAARPWETLRERIMTASQTTY